MATNAAMVLAKDAGKKPRDLAEALAEKLRADPLVESVDIAGPGFINMTLKASAWLGALRALPSSPVRITAAAAIGQGAKVNVEYVLGQSDRADACGPLPRRRVRRCAGEPAWLSPATM